MRDLQKWYAAAGLALLVLMGAGTDSTGKVVTALTGVLSVAAVAAGVRRYRPARPAVWWIFAASIAATALPQDLSPAADADGTGYALLGAVTAVGTLGATVAPLLLVRMRAGRRDREGAIDSLILGLAITLVLRQVLLAGHQHVTSVPPLLVAVLTVVAGVTVAAGIRLVFLAPRAPSAWLLLGAAVSGQVIGVLMALANTDGGRIPSAAYLVAGLTRLLVGAAALHPSMATLTRPARNRPGMPYGRLLLLCAALPACVLAVFVEAGFAMATSFAGIGVIAVVVLVLIRLAGLLREREQARRLQEETARIGARAIDEADEDVLLRRTADAVASALDAAVVVETATRTVRAGTAPGDGGTLRLPLDGEDGGAIEVRRGRPLTADEHNCVETVAVILTGALRRGRSEAAVRHAALHDGLTGLPNRDLLARRLAEALAAPASARVALLFVDLDGFKGVNDRFGHLAGDRVLVEAAARMRAVVPGGDLLARFAGDEFVLLTSAAADLGALAGRLRAEVARPYPLESGTAVIGASVGVAVHDGAESGEHLLRRADAAMYGVKRSRPRPASIEVPASAR